MFLWMPSAEQVVSAQKGMDMNFFLQSVCFFGHRRKSSIKHKGVKKKKCPKQVCRAYLGRAYLHYSRKKCRGEVLFVNRRKKAHISLASPPAAHLCSKG